MRSPESIEYSLHSVRHLIDLWKDWPNIPRQAPKAASPPPTRADIYEIAVENRKVMGSVEYVLVYGHELALNGIINLVNKFRRGAEDLFSKDTREAVADYWSETSEVENDSSSIHET